MLKLCQIAVELCRIVSNSRGFDCMYSNTSNLKKFDTIRQKINAIRCKLSDFSDLSYKMENSLHLLEICVKVRRIGCKCFKIHW